MATLTQAVNETEQSLLLVLLEERRRTLSRKIHKSYGHYHRDSLEFQSATQEQLVDKLRKS
jgi:hypothetical protein